jgi:uncharacterized membrane protein
LINVTLYRRKECELCDQVERDLADLQTEIPHQLVLIDLDESQNLRETFPETPPVVEVGPYRLKTVISKQDLRIALGAARDRGQHLEKVGDPKYQARLERGHVLTGADRFSYWLSNHYMALFNCFFLIYAGLPFLAPVFMKTGLTGPARVIYAIYSPLCHQFAYRSWFLFGEQAAYPRELAHVDGLLSYEQATGNDSLDTGLARAFRGTLELGYKVALCERDVAIYGSIFIFGLVFAVTGRRLKSLPWYLWILIGIVPIGLDGFSQIPSLTNLTVLQWLPIRESTPILRTLTGFVFGFSTAWYGYPYVEETMLETRRLLTRKIAVVGADMRGPRV